MMFCRQEVLDTDVLVVGAGGAGTRAAIEAHERGVTVAIVTEGKLPSGCSSIAMGAIQAACGTGDSVDIHFRDTMVAGAYLNDKKLVEVMVNEALQRVQDLEEYGTRIVKENEKYKLFPFSGSTYPRAIVTNDPYRGGFMRGLVEEVKCRQIEIFENIIITSLLMENCATVGAMGVNLQTGNFLMFGSKSTVLASGGAGQLYPLTTNPQDVTGDGYAMAYRAGAELMDMEFTQSRACIIHPSALKGQPPPGDGLVTIGGRFYNALGERYMKKYDPVNMEKVTRDLMAIRTHKEIKAGKGTSRGGVYNDLSGVPEEQLKQFNRFLSACEVEGIDPRWQPIEWAPGIHHFMGGLRINERCETTVPGLYAAGEVAAGVHGANRLSANALTDTQVFGARAGRFAAERALSISEPKVDEKQIEVERNEICKILERKDGEDALSVRKEIKKIMGKYVSISRNKEELELAIRKIEKIKRSQLPKLCVVDEKPSSLREALKAASFVDVGEMVARAALMRTESRGAHYREDYSQRDDKNWLKNIVIRLQEGRMKLHLIPARP